MVTVAGRTSEAKAVSALTKTSGSAAVTAAAGTFSSEDVGRAVTGAGVPAGTTILSVQSGTAATLSANASATNTAAATLGDAAPAAAGYRGWSPESTVEAATYTVAAVNAGTNAPGRVTDTVTRNHEQRSRS
jgi:hypothetical protein